MCTRDKQMKIADVDATLEQPDVVMVESHGQVVVQAGVFEGVQLKVVSRMSIETRAGGTKVLNALTAKPFKEELVWLVEGVGMVKRTVDYINMDDDIVFSLLAFTQR